MCYIERKEIQNIQLHLFAFNLCDRKLKKKEFSTEWVVQKVILTVSDPLLTEVTGSKSHLINISLQIFKDGKRTIRERALKKGIYLVSVLWVESCRQSGKRVSEDLFPVISPEEAATPLLVGRLKRTKSMQPKAFEEDVQNSAGNFFLVQQYM